jgi:AcrR family transcriptional regulator
MTGQSRRDEYAEQTRAAVVEAAVALFAANGYAATTIDAVAAKARVAKGGVYHHFANKAELFEAAFVAMEERLLARITVAINDATDAEQMVISGIDVFLAECCEPDFRQIALLEAPIALGWARWKEIDERFFLGLVTAALDDLASTGRYEVPAGDLTARVLLAALAEAGLAAAAAARPKAEVKRAKAVILRMLHGLRAADGD